MERSDILGRVGSMQQLAYARRIRYEEGRAAGMRAIEVKNGDVRFVAMEDKALDVSEFEYRGVSLGFLSKPGLNGRNPFDTLSDDVVRSIMGGMFFTCGFENIGAPYTDAEGKRYPLHGRIRTSPAEHVRADAGWEGDDYAVTLSGEVREAELFGENLVLRRTVSSRLGEASIAVADEVVNEGFTPQPMMFMYHCNVGWPLLSESAEIVIPSIRVAPRDEAAAREPACAALTRWGTPGLDIAAGVVAQLRRAGVRRIDRPGWCTYEDRRFYSHRRDGTTGRIVGAALAAPTDGVGQ